MRERYNVREGEGDGGERDPLGDHGVGSVRVRRADLPNRLERQQLPVLERDGQVLDERLGELARRDDVRAEVDEAVVAEGGLEALEVLANPGARDDLPPALDGADDSLGVIDGTPEYVYLPETSWTEWSQ